MDQKTKVNYTLAEQLLWNQNCS